MRKFSVFFHLGLIFIFYYIPMKNLNKTLSIPPFVKKIERKSLIKFVLIVVGIIVISVLALKYSTTNNLSMIKDFVTQQGLLGMFVYILVQVLQIVIAVIPGEPFQLMGGYVYGNLLGFILSSIGIMLGSYIAFIIARKFGLPVVKYLVKEEDLVKVQKVLSSNKGTLVMFLIFLLPGLPKDVLVYAFGLTPIPFSRFFMLYFIARVPGMFIANLLGATATTINYMAYLPYTLFLLPLILVVYIKRDDIKNMFNLTLEEC